MIDYAYPTMMAENALKALHHAMLSNRHDDAIADGKEALVQVANILMAIEHMKKNEPR